MPLSARPTAKDEAGDPAPMTRPWSGRTILQGFDPHRPARRTPRAGLLFGDVEGGWECGWERWLGSAFVQTGGGEAVLVAGGDEGVEERVGLEGLGLELGVELAAEEERGGWGSRRRWRRGWYR